VFADEVLQNWKEFGRKDTVTKNEKPFPACYIALKRGIVGRTTIENSMAFNTGN